MSKLDLVLKNCLLVNEGKQIQVDVGITNDRIEKIASEITSESKEVIDLEGKFLAPGIIDDQVHFRDPGLTEKGDIRSESLAAVHAGVTSTFDMPNVNPNMTTMELLTERNQLGAENHGLTTLIILEPWKPTLKKLKNSIQRRPADLRCSWALLQELYWLRMIMLWNRFLNIVL